MLTTTILSTTIRRRPSVSSCSTLPPKRCPLPPPLRPSPLHVPSTLTHLPPPALLHFLPSIRAPSRLAPSAKEAKGEEVSRSRRKTLHLLMMTWSTSERQFYLLKLKFDFCLSGSSILSSLDFFFSFSLSAVKISFLINLFSAVVH